jgi:hypothetical protein
MADIESPSVWVQWKGTELCADFRCACGAQGHIDDGFAYTVRCGACDQVWVLPQTLKLVRVEDATERDGHSSADPRPVEMDSATFGGLKT